MRRKPLGRKGLRTVPGWNSADRAPADSRCSGPGGSSAETLDTLREMEHYTTSDISGGRSAKGPSAAAAESPGFAAWMCQARSELLPV